MVDRKMVAGYFYSKRLRPARKSSATRGKERISLIVFPAIDLKDGVCVRLLRGEMGRATVFNADPAAQARAFAEPGFEWLHLVDLNGAIEGKPVNARRRRRDPRGGEPAGPARRRHPRHRRRSSAGCEAGVRPGDPRHGRAGRTRSW